MYFRAELGALGEPAGSSPRRGTSTRGRRLPRVHHAFGRLRPREPEAVFRAQTLLVHEWRRFPFLDPELPDDMLPARWPRGRAHALFHERHAAWDDTARAWFATLERGGEASGGARTAA